MKKNFIRFNFFEYVTLMLIVKKSKKNSNVCKLQNVKRNYDKKSQRFIVDQKNINLTLQSENLQ